MESHSQPLLLRVPTPDCQGLSFCEPDVRSLLLWLASLPKANLGEMARRLYQAVIELNRLNTGARNRLQLLELLRPEIHSTCKQLERYFLNQPIVLSERPRKTASLCQALQNHLATGYKLIVLELVAITAEHQLLTIALQRAIHSLRAVLTRSSQLYSPTPEGLWLELHHLYRIAAERRLQRTVVRDELARHTPGMSVEQNYLAALMLGCARCNQMRQPHIAQLAEVLEPWAALVRLCPAGEPTALLCIAPLIDGPPRYRAQLPSADRQPLIGLDPQTLTDAIHDHLTPAPPTRSQTPLPAADQLSSELLQHLGSAWGDISERSFQRTPGHGHVTLCIGMSAVHYYLAGQRLFNDLLQRPETPGSAVFKLNNAEPDVWATAFDAQVISDDGGLPRDEIEFIHPREDSAADADSGPAFPTYAVQVINHSPGGFCLCWEGEVPSQLQAGELLGVHEGGNRDWSIAVVRWIRQVRGGNPQMGIELIAPSAQPCGLRLLRKADAGSEYLRALLLPEIAVIGRSAALIVPRLPFQEGHKVQINQNGDEHRAMLHLRQASIGAYNQFEYRILGQTSAVQETSVTAQPNQSIAEVEDFDSLWKSL